MIGQNAKKTLGTSSYGYILQKGEIVLEGEVNELRASETVKRAYLTRAK